MFARDMQSRIRQPNTAVRSDSDGMGFGVGVFVAPAAKIAAIRRVNLNRRVGAGVNPDVLILVEGNAGDGAPRNVRRLLRPMRVPLVPRRKVRPRVGRRVRGGGFRGAVRRRRACSAKQEQSASELNERYFHNLDPMDGVGLGILQDGKDETRMKQRMKARIPSRTSGV